MNVTSTSDLGRLRMLQSRAVATRSELDRAGTEMSTGEKASRFQATGGNLTRLFALERSLDRNTVFSQNISLTEVRLDVMQESLGRLLAPVESLAIDLVAAVSLGDVSAARIHASSARSAFADAVSILNTQVAGQSIFAGIATDRPALAPSDAILADLDALAAGAATAADAITAIEDYFRKDPAPAGAFFGAGYVGATDDLTPVEIGEGRRLDYALRADSDELVATLRAGALAAVVAGGAFAGDLAAQMDLLGEAGAQMLAAKEGILDLRARVGISQETLERAKAERVSERDVLDLARASIVEADTLVAASTYQALEVQLESIYTVTARLANLRYSNFIR